MPLALYTSRMCGFFGKNSGQCSSGKGHGFFVALLLCVTTAVISGSEPERRRCDRPMRWPAKAVAQ